MASVEVDGDRVRAGIEALVRQVLAELHDLLLKRPRDPMRARPRPSGPRLQTRLALGIEPTDELVDPPP